MRWEGFMEVVQNQHRCMLLISIGSSMQGMRVYARNQRHSGQNNSHTESTTSTPVTQSPASSVRNPKIKLSTPN